MKFFWKHIWRSVRRAPLQPLFILLTVVCSVAVAVTALRLSVAFTGHSEKIAGENQLLGDLLISMRGDSNVRMLFREDAQELIGDKGDVIGEFRLSGFAERGEEDLFVSVSAVDLEKTDAFYQFVYTEYDTFTRENIDSSAVLSVTAAEKLGVWVGDTVTVRVLGESFSYTVRAVAEESGLLTDSDMLVSTHRISRALASRVPAIAALGDAFVPYTRLLVRLNDAAEGEAVKQLLESSDSFENMNVELTARESQYRFLALTQSVILWLPSVLILLLTVFLILNALHWLHTQRRTDTALFCACGASERHLALLQYMENGAYALLGSMGGLLLSFPLVQWAGAQYEWQTERLLPNPASLLFGFFWAVLLIEGCTAWHLYRHKLLPLAEQLQEVEGTNLPTPPKKMQWLPFGLSLLFFAIACAVPIKLRFIPAIVALILFVLFLFSAVQNLFGWMARGVQRLLELQKRPPWSLLFACKRLQTCSLLRHVARLFTILLSLLFALTVCVDTLQEQMLNMTDAVSSDYVAANADEETVAAVAAHPDVEGVLRFSYLPLVDVENGTTAFAFSVSDSAEGFLSFAGLPETRPQGDEVILSVGIAALAGADVGDELRLTVDGVSHTFTVSEIVKTHMHFVTFDVETLGMKHELLGINWREGVDSARAYEEVCALLEQNAAVLIDPQDIFETVPQTVTSHVTILRSGVGVASILTLISCIHVLSQLYHAQKQEHAILCQNGMTRGGIRRMIATELLVAVILSVLFSAVFGSILCALANFGIRSFGIVLFL